jgi:hypothetical protein
MCELSAQRQREQQEAVAVKERELARITEEKAALQAEVDKMSNTSETQVRGSLMHRHLLVYYPGGGGPLPYNVRLVATDFMRGCLTITLKAVDGNACDGRPTCGLVPRAVCGIVTRNRRRWRVVCEEWCR